MLDRPGGPKVCKKTYAYGPLGVCLAVFLALPAGGERRGEPLDQRLPDVLVEPREILPNDNVPKGTFVRTGRDFILARGARFKGPAPKGNAFRIEFEGRVIEHAGEWNNEIAAELEKLGPGDRKALRDALRRLQAGLDGDPQFFPFLYNAGRTLLLMNRPRLARRFFDRARGVLPEYAGTYINLGRANAFLRQHHATERAYRRAARINPFDPQPLVELGNYFLEEGSQVKARYFFRAVLRDHPGYSNARIGLARLVMASGDLNRARLLFREVPTEYLDGTPRTDYDRVLHYYLAEIAARTQDYAEALRQYDRLLAEPEDPFFLSVPIQDIRSRREVMRRLAEVQSRR